MTINSICAARNRRRFVSLVAVLAVLVSWAVAAPSVRDVLTPEEFERAGLNKLTATELQFLGERLLGAPAQAPRTALGGTNTTTPSEAASAREDAPPTVSGESGFGREKQVQADMEKAQAWPREVRSRISGRFVGWSGRTVFHLDNGQVWQQVDPATFSVSLESPNVTVRKGRFGAFYLGVDGYGSQVKVKRIR